jgi:hypothetical protein
LNDFTLRHEKGRLFAIIEIDEKKYEKEVTGFFNKSNAHDEWLDYCMGLDIHTNKEKLVERLKEIKEIREDTLEDIPWNLLVKEKKRIVLDFSKSNTYEEDRVLSEKIKGTNLREEWELDKLDDLNDSVVIVFPKNIMACTSAFFFSLFGKSLDNLGKQRFENKYILDCNASLIRTIKDGITRWERVY